MPAPDRHLDARQRRGASLVRVAQRDQQVERQVRDERERVRRVGGLRRDQREDVLEVVLAQPRAVPRPARRSLRRPDAVLLQRERSTSRQQPRFCSLESPDHRRRTRRSAAGACVRRPSARARPAPTCCLRPPMRFMKNSSRFEPTMRQELHPLEQRRPVVLGLVQHAEVEGRARSARGSGSSGAPGRHRSCGSAASTVGARRAGCGRAGRCRCTAFVVLTPVRRLRSGRRAFTVLARSSRLAARGPGLEGVADGLEHLDPRVALVVALDQTPGGDRRAGPLDHVVDGQLVVGSSVLRLRQSSGVSFQRL